MMINIKQAAKGTVKFEYFRDNALWYSTEAGDIFPVPVEEAESATFNKVEKGMYLMRWMRKWNDSHGNHNNDYSEEEKYRN